MKSMPWEDICSEADWRTFITDYQDRKITSRSTTFGDRFHRRRHIDDNRLDDTLNRLTRDISNYHSILKRSVENLPIRANMLRGIAHTAQGFLNRYRIGRKGTAGAARKGTLDYVVTKLVRRAERKAEYCFQLYEHVISPEKGNRAGSKEHLLRYLNRDRHHPDDLLGLAGDVRLEKLDPWHRPFEEEINSDFSVNYRPSHMFNAVFKLWMWDETDLPLFVWMEGHYICTGVFADDRWGGYTRGWVGGGLGMPVVTRKVGERIIEQKSSGQISYGENQTLHMIQIKGTTLHKWSLYSSESIPLHTLDALGKPFVPGRDFINTRGMYAYVWDKYGQIYAAEHAGGYFHHSSFTSGKKVKCAGMFKVDNGKVTSVNNNSGHYKPETRYLKNFVAFLRENTLFAEGAQVQDSHEKTTNSVREFMMQRPSTMHPPLRHAHRRR